MTILKESIKIIYSQSMQMMSAFHSWKLKKQGLRYKNGITLEWSMKIIGHMAMAELLLQIIGVSLMDSGKTEKNMDINESLIIMVNVSKSNTQMVSL